MTPFHFPFDEYCARIGCRSDGTITPDYLEALQRAQLYTIPFENFDILLGRGINLAPDHILNKLVRHQRGGYCFELNGLLLLALQTAGFKARPLLARVHLGGVISGRSHQLILVDLDGRQWLVDAGFGGICPRIPMALEYDTETLHNGLRFRLIPHELGHMLQHYQGGGEGGDEDGKWINLYSFDLTPVVPNDLLLGNHFTATHPLSFFTFSRVAVLCHPRGETRLFNYRCTGTDNGVETVETLPDGSGYLTALKERFGIELDARYDDLRPLATENSPHWQER